MTPSCAFIFDLDGTLVDSLPDIHNALSFALKRLQLTPVDISQTRSWIGDGLPALCRKAAPQLDQILFDELVEHARMHYQSHVVDHTRPYPNIMQMLDLLKLQDFPCAVLTNKPHPLAVETIDRLGMTHYFREVVGYQREEDKKPNPKPALRMAAGMGVSPQLVFFVGDSRTDMRTAQNAGMNFVAVSWGYQNFSDLGAEMPKNFVKDPLEIPRLTPKKTFTPPP